MSDLEKKQNHLFMDITEKSYKLDDLKIIILISLLTRLPFSETPSMLHAFLYSLHCPDL